MGHGVHTCIHRYDVHIFTHTRGILATSDTLYEPHWHLLWYTHITHYVNLSRQKYFTLCL